MLQIAAWVLAAAFIVKCINLLVDRIAGLFAALAKLLARAGEALAAWRAG